MKAGLHSFCSFCYHFTDFFFVLPPDSLAFPVALFWIPGSGSFFVSRGFEWPVPGFFSPFFFFFFFHFYSEAIFLPVFNSL